MASKDRKTDQQRSGYDAQDITVLEGLEAVRKRPGMYIGSTGVRGLHHLVYEVVDNSVDEALAGHCDAVSVTIHPDNSITVVDDGRGIPVDVMEKEGKPAVEVVLTVLHAGGKFGDGGGYKVSGGLHGVGVSVVNALSESLHVEVRRDGFTWTQDYARGIPQGDLQKGEPTKETGTTITFLPDAEVFETLDFDFATLEQRLRETAFLTRGLRISIDDERGENRRAEFQYDGGIEDFVSFLNENKDPIQKKVVFFAGESDEGAVEVALQWNSSYQESVFSFANNINTHEGGSHLSGFRVGADAHAQPLRARDRRAQGEGREPLRRGRPRGPDRRHLGQADRPAVRGPDQDQARQSRHGGLRRLGGQREARPVPRGEPAGGARGDPQGRLRRPGPRRRPQGARPHAQVGARAHRAARQAGRLHGQGRVTDRAVHRRGRLRRRLGQAGPRPRDPGRAAAARQDPQRREGADRQGAPEHRDPGADHRARHRRARRVRPREGPLPQDHPDDGRRRRRRPHPHADPHAAVPRDAGAGRGRLRLHRQAAALQDHAGQARALRREGVRVRGVPARRQAREVRDRRPRRAGLQAHRHALAALLAAAQAVRGLGQRPARRLRPRGRSSSSRSRRSSTTRSSPSRSCSSWSGATTRRTSPTRPSWSRPTTG